MESHIRGPVPASRAFTTNSEAAAWSQAGLLATLGVQLTEDGDLLDDMPPGAVRVRPLRRPFSRSDARHVLTELGSGVEPSGSTFAVSASLTETQARLWSQATSSAAAATLLYVSMESPHPVVRAVSAAEVLRLTREPDRQALDVLAEECDSPETAIRTIATHALTRAAPSHPALLTTGGERPAPPQPTPTPTSASLLVHGTFARLGSTWWRPGSAFFTYIKSNVSANLYDKSDYFRWTGRYSGDARGMGAEDFTTWVRRKQVELDTVFAHSHGGNVVLDAAADGVRMRLLTLLSVPARKRSASQWAAITRNVGRVFALRVRCDVVVLCDRARQEYRRPVRTLALNIWFDHGAVLSPSVWERYDLPKEIRSEHALA